MNRKDFLSDLQTVQLVRKELPIVKPTSCQNCGACCGHMGYPPFVPMYEDPEHLTNSDPEWLELRESHPELAAECLQGAKDRRGDKELPCLWLDPVTKGCRHYEHRPQVCRDFEMGSEDCVGHRQLRGIG